MIASCSSPVLRAALLTLGIGLTLTACSEVRPQSRVSRALDSGVTSSDGGGMAPAHFGNFGPIPPR